MIWVYGNSFESFLVAIVVPDKRKLMTWAADNGVDGSFEDVCKDPKVRLATQKYWESKQTPTGHIASVLQTLARKSYSLSTEWLHWDAAWTHVQT